MLTMALKPRRLPRIRLLFALAAGLMCWLSVSRVRPAGAFTEWSFDDSAVNSDTLAVQFGNLNSQAQMVNGAGATAPVAFTGDIVTGQFSPLILR